MNPPTHQRQSIQQKEGEDHQEASQNDKLDCFYNMSQEKSHNKDETSIEQTPGEPKVERKLCFSISRSTEKEDLEWIPTSFIHSAGIYLVFRVCKYKDNILGMNSFGTSICFPKTNSKTHTHAHAYHCEKKENIGF